MENKANLQANQNTSEHTIPQASSIKIKIFNIACIVLFVVGIVFFICFLDRVLHTLPPIRYQAVIIISAIAAVVIIVLCFFRTRTKITAIKFVALIIAAIVLAGNWYIYFRYIPKYGPADGCVIVKEDPEYTTVTIEPRYDIYYDENGEETARSSSYYKLEDNPFFEWGYILNVVSEGKVTAWIAFDPATGKYALFYEPKE